MNNTQNVDIPRTVPIGTDIKLSAASTLRPSENKDRLFRNQTHIGWLANGLTDLKSLKNHA